MRFEMDKFFGFSLIELLVVLAIVGILTAISFPIYSQHLVKEKRLEAIITLNKLAGALENYYLINNSYKGATLSSLGFMDKIADNNYQLAISTLTDSEFSLTATPLAKQAEKDLLCGCLTLDSKNEKHISGTGNLIECW